MSGSHELAEHFAEMLAPVGAVSSRRFFGGWALTRAGVQFAMVMDTIYFCVDDGTRPGYEASGGEPFSYQSGVRRVEVRRYYSAPADAVDSPQELCRLAEDALAVAESGKKKPAKAKAKAKAKAR